MKIINQTWLKCIIIAATVGLTACSSVPELEQNAEAPKLKVPPEAKKYSMTAQISDPWEGFNRRMYYFNAKADEYVLLPVVKGYETIMPDFMEDGVSNFFDNLGELTTLLNSMLQVKGESSVKTLGRFVVNSTVGIVGLFDVATPMGIEEQNEDFGQTLGYWGVGPGNYLVLPLLGPSSVRDATGTLVDAVAFQALLDEADIKSSEELMLKLLQVIDTRKNLPFRYYASGSAFEYEQTKLLYTKFREIQIAR